jgi:hypothetical protein
LSIVPCLVLIGASTQLMYMANCCSCQQQHWQWSFRDAVNALYLHCTDLFTPVTTGCSDVVSTLHRSMWFGCSWQIQYNNSSFRVAGSTKSGIVMLDCRGRGTAQLVQLRCHPSCMTDRTWILPGCGHIALPFPLYSTDVQRRSRMNVDR